MRAEDGDTLGTLGLRYGWSAGDVARANGLALDREAMDTWVMMGTRDPWQRNVVTGGGGRREPFIAALSPDVARRLGRALMTTKTRVFVWER